MRVAITLCIALLVGGPTQAGGIPDSEDIASKLAGPKSTAKTRGLGLGPEKSRGIRLADGPQDAPASIDLDINFEFDSASLTASGMVLVGNLGRALKDDPRLTGKRFRIEGHTDAKGSDAYNQSLSERRASAVRRELMASYGLDGSKLESIGYGKAQLLDRTNPESGVNRRVRITNLGDSN
jgi:outer membrane protein OmpA-like peptidoglycan-associated protein